MTGLKNLRKKDFQQNEVVNTEIGSIAIRLRQLMNASNIGEHELSRQTGVKQPIIHRLLSGENTNPKLATLKPVADYFSVSISELIGEPLSQNADENPSMWRELPVFTQAQLKNLSRKKNPYSTIITDSSITAEAFAFLIDNPSMEPLFLENAIAIVEPHFTEKNNDYILCKLSDSSIDVRQLLLLSGKIHVTPLNRKFGSITPLTSNTQILGVVVRTIYDLRH